MQASKSVKTRRVELILRQIDSLPTLPHIATRIMTVTADDSSDARKVIELVKSDQALTGKILSLCRAADKGVRSGELTIDRAVVMLGFNAIRNAVFSIKVFETFGLEHGKQSNSKPRTSCPDPSVAAEESHSSSTSTDPLNRCEFWRHCLAVAVAAELIAQMHGEHKDLKPAEAFICGLLHDIGKLALDHILPKSFARVVQLADENQSSLADFEQRVMGIDHHTAGKRLAEQWQLPHSMQDAIWLHGSAYELLPDLKHRRLIGLINLADHVARQNHLGHSGNYALPSDPSELATKIGLNPSIIDSITAELHEEVHHRAEVLGLDDNLSSGKYIGSLQQANQALGRLNTVMHKRASIAVGQKTVLEAISRFHRCTSPRRNVHEVLDQVVANAASIFKEGFYAILYQDGGSNDPSESWLIGQYGLNGRSVGKQLADPPPQVRQLSEINPSDSLSIDLMSLHPWLIDHLTQAPDIRRVRLLPLTCAWGTAAILLHDRPKLPSQSLLNALITTWGGAIAAAKQHDGARVLDEQLTETSNLLSEAQDQLLRNESMARLGEMAAGAAHEMNNPLTVISGRSQLLATNPDNGSWTQQAAQTIVDQVQQLSDLITSLRMFTDPPRAKRRATDVGNLLHNVVEHVRRDHVKMAEKIEFFVQISKTIPVVLVDPEQISLALIELLNNAITETGTESVHLSAKHQPEKHVMLFQVSDDGAGMDADTLSHAMDPFFSARKAGRGTGLGLARAQQWIASHGGTLEIRSTPDVGTRVTMTVPLTD